jgi:hypothetical protein
VPKRKRALLLQAFDTLGDPLFDVQEGRLTDERTDISGEGPPHGAQCLCQAEGIGGIGLCPEAFPSNFHHRRDTVVEFDWMFRKDVKEKGQLRKFVQSAPPKLDRVEGAARPPKSSWRRRHPQLIVLNDAQPA